MGSGLASCCQSPHAEGELVNTQGSGPARPGGTIEIRVFEDACPASPLKRPLDSGPSFSLLVLDSMAYLKYYELILE